jgi:hypothetical protein
LRALSKASSLTPFSTKYNWLGSKSVDATLGVDDQKPFKEIWKASIDGRAALSPDAIVYIRTLSDNGKLLVRTSRSDGKIKEKMFDLGNAADIRTEIARACNWDETPTDPVGLSDHAGSPH